MKLAFERPFRPLEVTDSVVSSFSLLKMGQQLMTEDTFKEIGRDSLCLARGQDMTVVLMAFTSGGGLPDHHAPGPITVTVLSGHIEFSTSTDSETLSLKTGDVGVCAAHLVHSVKAKAESISLLVIGGQVQS